MAERIASLQADVTLNAEGFAAGAAKLTTSAKGISKALDNLGSPKLNQTLDQIALKVKNMGGVAALNAPQIAKLRIELDKLAAAGLKIPKSLQLPKISSADLGGALKTQGLSALQGQAVSLGPLGGVLAGLGPAGIAAGAGIAAVGAAATATAAVIGSLVVGLTETASKLADLSAKTSLSTDFLQEIAFAGKQVGVSLEEIGAASTKLSANIGQGDKIFEKLGLSLERLQSLNADEQFLAVANAIKAIPDPATQAAAAMEAFGRGGVELLPLIRSDMAGAAAEAKRLGLVLSTDVVGAGDRLDDTLAKLSTQFDALKNAIAGQLVEGGQLNDLLRGISEAMAGLLTVLPQIVSGIRLLGEGFLNAVPGGTVLVATLGLVTDKLREIGRFSGIKAPTIEELDVIRDAPQTSLATDLGLDAAFQAQLKAATDETRKLGAERLKAANEAKAAEDKYIKAVSDGIRLQFDKLAKLRSAREASSLALESVQTGGASEANLKSAQLQAQIIDNLDVAARAGAEGLQDIQAATEDFVDSLSSREIENFVEEFDALRKAGADIPEGLGAITEGVAQLAFDDAANQMAEAEDAAVELYKTLASLGQIPGFTPEAIDAVFGRIPEEVDQAKGATIDWAQELQNISNLAQTLPGIFGQAFGAILGGVAGIGNSIQGLFKNFTGEGKTGGIFGALTGKQGIDGIFGALSGIGSAIGAAVGIGKAIGDLFGKSDAEKAAEKAGKLLGRKVSEEMGQEIVNRAKETGKSIEQVIKDIKFEELQAKFSDLQSKAKTNAGLITGALGGFGKIAGAAQAQGRIFGKQFWAVVATDGFDAALDAFGSTFAGLSDELKAAIPSDIQNLFKFGENEQFKAAVDGASAMADSFKGTVGLIGLSSETMADFGQVAQASFDQAKIGAIEAGATQEEAQKAALQAVIPLLAQMKAASLQSGEALDPASAGLLAQAEAAGINIPIDPLIEVADILRQMLDLQRQMAGLPPLAPKVDTSALAQVGPAAEAAGAEAGGKFSEGMTRGVQIGAQAVVQTAGQAGSAAGAAMATGISSSADQVAATMTQAGQEGAAGFETAIDTLKTATQESLDGTQSIIDKIRTALQSLDGIRVTPRVEVQVSQTGGQIPGTTSGAPLIDPPKFGKGGFFKAKQSGELALLHGPELIIPLGASRRRQAEKLLARFFDFGTVPSFKTGGLVSGMTSTSSGGGSDFSGVGASTGSFGGGAGSVTIGTGAIQIGPITVQGGSGAGDDLASQLEQEMPRISAALSAMIQRGIEASR